jgi:hypothetical protein
LSQETLTENAPLILDSTCSYMHIDFSHGKRFPEFASIRMDKRRIVRPDIVADARFLPFREGVFDTIYCDPPHLFRKNPDISTLVRHNHSTGRVTPSSFERYSFWKSREEWYDFLERTDQEFARTLKPKGKLNYKISNGKSSGLTKLSDLDRMRHFEITRKIENSHSAIGNEVYFLTMSMPKNENPPLPTGKTVNGSSLKHTF